MKLTVLGFVHDNSELLGRPVNVQARKYKGSLPPVSPSQLILVCHLCLEMQLSWKMKKLTRFSSSEVTLFNTNLFPSVYAGPFFIVSTE